MKKTFLIIMLFLLPFQYTWAMVASYDTHGKHDNQAHFGHHEHPIANHELASSESTSHKLKSIVLKSIEANGSVDNVAHPHNKQDNSDKQAAQNHVHYGFCHLSCGEVLGYDLPSFDQSRPILASHYLFNYHSPPANTLDRPNRITLASFGELS